MTFNLFHVYTLLSLLLVGSHAVSPDQVYWKSVLPNTPMPKAIKDLLYIKAWNDGNDQKVTTNTPSTYIKLKDEPQQIYSYFTSRDEVKDHPPSVLNDEVKDHSNSNSLFRYFTQYDALNDEVKDQPQSIPLIRYFNQYDASNDELVKDDHPQSIPLIRYFNQYDASNDEVKDHPPSVSNDEVKDHPKSIPLIRYFTQYDASNDEVKDDHPQSIPLIRYFSRYGASNNEVKDSPFAQLLFLKNDLYQGKEIKLQFNIYDQKTKFLPKDIIDSIPFSSKDLPEIYSKLSIKPDSMQAKIMKETLDVCEVKSMHGEEKFCATSLESMIDFATTKLDKKVTAFSTEGAKESTLSQKYKVEVVKKLAADKIMVCHKQLYPYVVFYCHIISGTESYMVSLESSNGPKVKSLAVCHTDMSKWNPKHLAFQVLKVTPGTVPVCHFLLEDTILWVPYQ
ncbi:hypothetical protein QVD17_32520 [Tagetes erecta]|uniref:BURP domain-containing protein n=1 Tax=Tagetes erecta TaxID=13708 RepID=A0AAD8NKU2_TARER|nr:hypothetical protein QVD17_32520 [Tagetes erecta]